MKYFPVVILVILLVNISYGQGRTIDRELSPKLGDRRVIFKESVNYREAKRRCTEHWSSFGKPMYHLYVPRVPADNIKLYEVLKQAKVDRVWIGVSGGVNPKNRTWEDARGLPIGQTFWGPKEPNNFRAHDERCVEIRVLEKNNGTMNWNDAPCDRLNRFICIPNKSVANYTDLK